MTTSKVLKVLVTGSNGQLGQELVNLTIEGIELRGCSRDSLDIRDLQVCRDVISGYKPDVIIHCAAYTAVDKAESDPDEAFRVNSIGTRNVALAARECGAKLCYISTDYVFDGSGKSPYKEIDATNPQTIYGKSKLGGEHAVSSLHDRYFIVRTSWVYGKYGSNFVKTMLKLADERDQLKVVHDQVGAPTYTFDLALFLLELIKTDYYGIYHASNTGACSWYDLAKAIFEERAITTRLEPCMTDEFTRPAQRPPFSVLDHSAIRANGLADLRHWRAALADFLGEM